MSDAVSGGGVGGDGGVFILFFLGYPKLVSPEKRKSGSFVVVVLRWGQIWLAHRYV